MASIGFCIRKCKKNIYKKFSKDIMMERIESVGISF